MILKKALLCFFLSLVFKEKKAHACRDKSMYDGREAKQKVDKVLGSSQWQSQGLGRGAGESAALGQVI